MSSARGKNIIRHSAIEKGSTSGGGPGIEEPLVQGEADAMRSSFAAHDRRILLLQGGGALGAYHAGVYEGLAERRVHAGLGRGHIDRSDQRRADRGQPAGASERTAAGILGSCLVAGADRSARLDGFRAANHEPDGRRFGDVLRYPRLLRSAGAGAAVGSRRDVGGTELLRHGAVAGHAGKAGRLRPHQCRRRPVVARLGQRAHRRVGLLRQHRSFDHGEPRDGEWRAPAGFPAGGDRWRVLLRRRDHVQHPAAVRRETTSAWTR